MATDWEEIRRRLDTIRAAIVQSSARSPDEERRILKARAQALAKEPERGAAADETIAAVEFDLASERYAFPLSQVREVSVLRELTPVPCTPAFVLGIINVRGEIRTVIDLKKFFDLPAAGITELNKIIIIERGEMQLGVLADAIRGVSRILLSDLQPTLPTLTDIRADYLRGITSERLVVLDAAKILSDPRILVEERDEA
ncbi:MAG TPA: chemotaxis protein CheW [Chthoniobacteraceae bacterium]|nr:chemotaxis protein CheW [Chthoniobacteraceae bacterium]